MNEMKNKSEILQIAEFHDRQANYWKMVRGQSWGREKSMRDRQRDHETFHRRMARMIRKLGR